MENCLCDLLIVSPAPDHHFIAGRYEDAGIVGVAGADTILHPLTEIRLMFEQIKVYLGGAVQVQSEIVAVAPVDEANRFQGPVVKFPGQGEVLA